MSDPLGFVAMRASLDRAEKIYSALRKTGGLKDHRMITYRCEARRCMLADIINTPSDVIIYFPRYRLSPDKNGDSSVATARKKNTVDGDRRWIAHVAVLRHTGNLTFNCDHVLSKVLDLDEVEADIRAGHAEVLVRADGQRCSV